VYLRPSDILEFRLWNSDHVISSLTQTGLFASVAYAGSDTSTPMILVEAVEPPPVGVCDGQDILLPMMTMGVFPAICARNRGVYLAFIGRRLPWFACDWPQTEMAGWFPVFLVTSFGYWTRSPNNGAFVNHGRACVLAQWEAFTIAATAP
jgi:hypothetical protein